MLRHFGNFWHKNQYIKKEKFESIKLLTAVRSTESWTPSSSETLKRSTAGTSSMGIVLMTSKPLALVASLPFLAGAAGTEGDSGWGRGGMTTLGISRRDLFEALEGKIGWSRVMVVFLTQTTGWPNPGISTEVVRTLASSQMKGWIMWTYKTEWVINA